MKRAPLATLLVATLAAAAPAAEVPKTPSETRPVDLAICLDTSGSMEKLIDAARQKLWTIVNDLALAKPTPSLRVALLTYGNQGHPADVGWVKLDVPLTEDLDKVSEILFALTTNGGDEYVGRVLQAAVDQLEWSTDPDSLKLICVAGNESAEQDPAVDFRAQCKRAIEAGIMVNSIYCGNAADELAPAWREVSQRADGHFAAIDHLDGTVIVSTPFDDELAKLGTLINGTYLPYGQWGAQGCENQVAQDSNAAGLNGAAAASRAATKAGALYKCATWDLVDGCEAGTVKLEEMKDEDLPEALRGKTLEEKKQIIAEARKKRGEIQKQVADLDLKRRRHVEQELKKLGQNQDQAFDRAVRDAVRRQAATRGFEFPADPDPVVESTTEEADDEAEQSGSGNARQEQEAGATGQTGASSGQQQRRNG